VAPSAGGGAVTGDAKIEAQAQAKIGDALVEVAQHKYWVLAGLGAVPPIVDIGCPSLPLPMTIGVRWSEAVVHMRGSRK